MHLSELTTRLDDELRTTDFAEIDGSPNGLQVGPDEATIERAAFAVDAVGVTIEEAVAADADLLVTHHGLWWEGTERLTGPTHDRVASLLTNELALYVSHLPLDAHPELGNAAGVADVLDLAERAAFGSHRGEHLGQRGRLPKPTRLSTLAERLETELAGASGAVQTLPFGSERIEDVAILTGSGIDWLEEAVEADVDVLVTGEATHMSYHDAREAGMNVIVGGHYATETPGVRALQSLVGQWGVDTIFIDHPTGL